MSEIYVKENESLDNALKRFKRSCAKSGVLADLRKKEYYQSPSVKRRKKSEAARKNKNKRFYELPIINSLNFQAVYFFRITAVFVLTFTRSAVILTITGNSKI